MISAILIDEHQVDVTTPVAELRVQRNLADVSSVATILEQTAVPFWGQSTQLLGSLSQHGTAVIALKGP